MLCKICGLTRLEDVTLCHDLGVEFTGFIFAGESPRRVTPAFVASLPGGPSRRVGVFAGFDPDAVLRVAESARLDYIQLHGDEDPAFCRAVGPGRVIRTLWPQRCSPRELRGEMERFAQSVAYFLLDAGKSGGGSGKRLDLRALGRIEAPAPWFLAGGVGPERLRRMPEGCRPDGVDMNSALEDLPGVKNRARVIEAVELARAL
jgi:phosphoribosylanthranilate isomerase